MELTTTIMLERGQQLYENRSELWGKLGRKYSPSTVYLWYATQSDPLMRMYYGHLSTTHPASNDGYTTQIADKIAHTLTADSTDLDDLIKEADKVTNMNNIMNHCKVYKIRLDGSMKQLSLYPVIKVLFTYAIRKAGLHEFKKEHGAIAAIRRIFPMFRTILDYNIHCENNPIDVAFKYTPVKGKHDVDMVEHFADRFKEWVNYDECIKKAKKCEKVDYLTSDDDLQCLNYYITTILEDGEWEEIKDVLAKIHPAKLRNEPIHYDDVDINRIVEVQNNNPEVVKTYKEKQSLPTKQEIFNDKSSLYFKIAKKVANIIIKQNHLGRDWYEDIRSEAALFMIKKGYELVTKKHLEELTLSGEKTSKHVTKSLLTWLAVKHCQSASIGQNRQVEIPYETMRKLRTKLINGEKLTDSQKAAYNFFGNYKQTSLDDCVPDNTYNGDSGNTRYSDIWGKNDISFLLTDLKIDLELYLKNNCENDSERKVTTLIISGESYRNIAKKVGVTMHRVRTIANKVKNWRTVRTTT